MGTFSWNENSPTETSYYSGDAGEVRSLKSNFAGGVARVVGWPGSGGSTTAQAGIPKPGFAAGAFVGPQSTLSSSQSYALMVSLDSAYSSSSTASYRLWNTSVTTNLVGSHFGVESRWSSSDTYSAAADIGPAPARYVLSGGTLSLRLTPSPAAIQFPLVYGAPPRMWGIPFAPISSATTDLSGFATSFSTITTGGCYIDVFTFRNSAGTVQSLDGSAAMFGVHWLSLGTVPF